MPLYWTENDGEVYVIMYRILYETENTKYNNTHCINCIPCIQIYILTDDD